MKEEAAQLLADKDYNFEGKDSREDAVLLIGRAGPQAKPQPQVSSSHIIPLSAGC